MIDILIKVICNIVKLYVYNVIYFIYINFEFKKIMYVIGEKNEYQIILVNKREKKSIVIYK